MNRVWQIVVPMRGMQAVSRLHIACLEVRPE